MAVHGFKRTVTNGFIWSVLQNTVMEVNGFKRTVDGFKRTVRVIIVLILDWNGFKRAVNGFKRTVTCQNCFVWSLDGVKGGSEESEERSEERK